MNDYIDIDLERTYIGLYREVDVDRNILFEPKIG